MSIGPLPLCAAVLVVLDLLVPRPASAAEIAGQADPRFQAALAQWLADDAGSLPVLAALASEDNRAAQVLLALIDVSAPLQGPWLVALPRAERRALMRAPGGVSGRSWMAAAAADTPLAAAWMKLWDASDRNWEELIRSFAALGERRAMRLSLFATHLREQRGFAALADEPFYPAGLRFLVWLEWADDPATAPRVAAEIAALHPGNPQIAVMTGEPASAAERAGWLAEDPSASPLRAFCAAACPASQTSCAEAAFAFHAGAELADFGSPVEAIVASDDWEVTPRGRATVLRRTLPADPVMRDRKLAELTALDACFGAELTATAARFARK